MRMRLYRYFKRGCILYKRVSQLQCIRYRHRSRYGVQKSECRIGGILGFNTAVPEKTRVAGGHPGAGDRSLGKIRCLFCKIFGFNDPNLVK